ncbi:hypothetical protein ACFQU7_42145 [Pseudoroseomonas wenyumeiae]
MRGGFGRHLNAGQVILYRDNWHARVRKRRERADELLVRLQIKDPDNSKPAAQPAGDDDDAEDNLLQLLDKLPDVLEKACADAQAGWGGGTQDMARASYEVSEVLKGLWLRLAAEFPENHFGQQPADKFLEQYLQQRYQWQAALAEPYGSGTGGTIVGPLIAGGVMHDLADMVEQTATALRSMEEPIENFERWKARWKKAMGKTQG